MDSERPKDSLKTITLARDRWLGAFAAGYANDRNCGQSGPGPMVLRPRETTLAQRALHKLEGDPKFLRVFLIS